MNAQHSNVGANNQDTSVTFRVVLNGLRTNALRSETIAKLAALFKATTVQVETLLNTPSYVLKKRLSFDAASKYKSAIDSAGGNCELVAEQRDVKLVFDFVEAVTPEPALRAEKGCEQATTKGGTISSPEPASSVTSTKVPPPIDAQTSPGERIWWYAQGGHQLGPVSMEELRSFLASGNVSAVDKAWCEGMLAWQPIASIEAFAQVIAPIGTKPPPIDQGIASLVAHAKHLTL